MLAITELRSGGYSAKSGDTYVRATVRKNVWGEWVVRLRINGVHQKESDYHTDDKKDALDTAQRMIRESLELGSKSLTEKLAEALQAASEHLDYCGYGDKWERECATAARLPEKIALALAAYAASKEGETQK